MPRMPSMGWMGATLRGQESLYSLREGVEIVEEVDHLQEVVDLLEDLSTEPCLSICHETWVGKI